MEYCNLVEDFVSFEKRDQSWVMKFKSTTEKWSWWKFKFVEETKEYTVLGNLFKEDCWMEYDRGEPCFRHIVYNDPQSPYFIDENGDSREVTIRLSSNLRGVYKLYKLGYLDA